MSKKNDILTAVGAEGAPDFIVEILSPKTAFLDKKSKSGTRSQGPSWRGKQGY